MPDAYTNTSPVTNTQIQTQGGSQSGSVDNNQAVNAQQTGTTTGNQNQANTYSGGQAALQQATIDAAGNYIQSGAPPPGVTGAPPQLVSAYMSQFNQNVAPQIAAAQGPGSAAIGSNLALGLEQLNANVYGTNLNAYQNAMAQAGSLAFNPIGQSATNAQNSVGQSGQTSTSNTDTSQNWQQALADLQHISETNTVSGTI